MIIDTSVLVTLFSDEPERRDFVVAMSQAPARLVATGSWVEFATVLVRRFGVPNPVAMQSTLRDQFNLNLAIGTAEQATIAAEGYARFGKGAGHRARLNFGDCFAYALAKATGEPLLFKGDDFNHTDLLLAPASAYPR